MSNVSGKIFCQLCRTANGLGEELCARCGTRLMLLVEPTTSRFEGRSASTGMEEHLLERVTGIETSISRLLDKMEKMAELMLKQSRTAHFDHALLDTLVTILTESGLVNPSRLRTLWRERYRGDAVHKPEPTEETQPGGPASVVLQAYRGDEGELFARLVREGFESVERGKQAGGVRTLERAATLSKDNAPLNTYLGVYFFRAGKPTLARDYLKRASEAEPKNSRLLLLLGLAAGDEGDAASAREILKKAVERGGPSFAAHCALGRLAAAESDWKGALEEFKRAQAARPCPEGDYLIGLACYYLGRFKTALRHSKKAVGADAGFGAAFRLLGLVQQRVGADADAKKSFKKARSLGSVEAQVSGAWAGRKGASTKTAQAPTLFETKGRGRRRLLTGGDARLAAALREDALAGFAPR